MGRQTFNLSDGAIGRSSAHIDWHQLECPVHQELVEPLQQLKTKAAVQGFDLQIASGFRSFDRQLAIWNAKAVGDRAILDDKGTPLDASLLSSTDKVFAILRWSALPGASRHHWGTDIDVYDASRISAAGLHLVPAEYCEQGPCAELVEWLSSIDAFEFQWPYLKDVGAVAPEPWHLSFMPLAYAFQQALTRELLLQTIEMADIELKPQILRNFDSIYDRFVSPYL